MKTDLEKAQKVISQIANAIELCDPDDTDTPTMLKFISEALAAERAAVLGEVLPKRVDFIDWAKHLDSDGYFGALDAYDYLLARLKELG